MHVERLAKYDVLVRFIKYIQAFTQIHTGIDKINKTRINACLSYSKVDPNWNSFVQLP